VSEQLISLGQRRQSAIIRAMRTSLGRVILLRASSGVNPISGRRPAATVMTAPGFARVGEFAKTASRHPQGAPISAAAHRRSARVAAASQDDQQPGGLRGRSRRERRRDDRKRAYFGLAGASTRANPEPSGREPLKRSFSLTAPPHCNNKSDSPSAVRRKPIPAARVPRPKSNPNPYGDWTRVHPARSRTQCEDVLWAFRPGIQAMRVSVVRFVRTDRHSS
jgi:hypothetical protein